MPFASLWPCAGDFRSSAISGHPLSQSACLKGAKSCPKVAPRRGICGARFRPHAREVRQLQSLRTSPPPVILPDNWQGTAIAGEVLGEELATKLRSQFKGGEMLYIRAPLSVNLKVEKGRLLKTHVDLFLRLSTPGERSQTLVVRGSITVPTEGEKGTPTGLPRGTCGRRSRDQPAPRRRRKSRSHAMERARRETPRQLDWSSYRPTTGQSRSA
jgi:hypothetical protein